MGLFTKDKNEDAEIRGLPDANLPKLTDERLVMLALARLFEAQGVDDEAMVQELYRRGSTLS